MDSGRGMCWESYKAFTSLFIVPRFASIVFCALVFFFSVLLVQARDYPKEIRGYKVARAKVLIKKTKESKAEASAVGSAKDEADALVELGEPRVAGLTPLGLTIEVPLTIAPVKQGGHVDFLSFEEMVVNGTPVTIEDYLHPFDLPNEHSLKLPEPVRIYISLPRVLLGAVDEWTASKEVWPVQGRVFVFGRYRKFLMKFKRVVPVELDLALPNPLRSEKPSTGALR